MQRSRDVSSGPVPQPRGGDAWPKELRYLARQNRVFVISGPAGVGKDEVIKKLLWAVSGLRKVVTNTTRPPREREEEGVDYHFCSREEFDLLIAEESLLEHASYAESYYGTPAEPVRSALAEGLDVVLKIEAQGAMKVRSRLPGAVLVFIAPESLVELRRRISARATEDADSIARRLDRASDELCLAGLYDYVVVNRRDRIDAAVAQVAAIVEAERLRASPHPVVLG